jgi:ABC-type Na+ efflux pump permease subunit
VDRIWVVARKDIRDLLQGKSYLYLFLIVAACLPYYDGIKSILGELTRQGASPEELRLASQSFLDSMAYTLPFILSMFACSIITNYSIVMDKAKRTLEPLLATPLSIRQIWMGKSLATALPGLVTGVVIGILAVMAVNIGVINPAVGGFVFPGVLPLISALIITPLLVLLVVALISFLQLITVKPAVSSIIFSLLFLGLYFPTIVADLTAGWVYAPIYLGAAVLLVVAMLAFVRLLTKERTALSSKG